MSSTSAVTSLTGAILEASGSVADFNRAVSRVTMVCVPSGTVTGGVVAMEASQDNANWVNVHIVTPQTGMNCYRTAPPGAFRYYRARVVAAITGGGSVKVTLMESEYNGGVL